MSRDKLGSVLVTGGGGFIGYHLVSKILETEPSCQISVLDLPTSLPRFPSVKYYDVDVSHKEDVQTALNKIRPRVVFHAACTYSLALPPETHSRVNTQGTLNVLEASQAVGTVKAFLFHSSTSVIEDGTSPLLNATEELPVLFAPQQKYPYPLSKALAEHVVLTANGKGGMLTVSMRPAGSFGEADTETMENLLRVAKSGRANVQMGDGKNVYDFLYVGNLVHAHLLAAHALLRDSSKYARGQRVADEERVDGEAFHITNDEPWLFWEFTREVAKQAGFEVKPGDIKVIPRWVGMLIAWILEWVFGLFWLIGLGEKKPALTRFAVRYSTLTRTVSCEKAKRRLGYKPIVGMREGIERSVTWFRENGKESL